ADPFVYSLPAGSLRLWTRNGDAQRDAARFDAVETPAADTGYFVASVGGEDQSYAMGDWAKLVAAAGGQAGDRTVTLWLEGIRRSSTAGDLSIAFGIDPDGDISGATVSNDVVRATTVQCELVDARAFQPQMMADG